MQRGWCQVQSYGRALTGGARRVARQGVQHPQHDLVVPPHAVDYAALGEIALCR